MELADSLKWWENRPLWGKTVLVTRSRDQASRLVELLNAAGARCLEVPTIEIGPPADFAPLDAASQHLGRYEAAIFTSANGVRAFMDRLFHMGASRSGARRLARGAAAGDIYLLHDGIAARPRAGEAHALEVLPALGARLAALGLRSVTLRAACVGDEGA